LVIWAPYLKRDTQKTAQNAARYLPDQRSIHFWDPWRFTSKAYAKEFRIPEEEAWDMHVLYKPHLQWQETVPPATEWFQKRKYKVGTPYSKAALESALREWIN
jgi:hypothetical protein